MMHETPQRAGSANNERVIGYQVGAALAGAAILPALAGLLVRWGGLTLLPKILMCLAVLLISAHEISAGRSGSETAD